MLRACLAIAAGLMLHFPALAHSSDGGMTYSAYCCSGDEATGDCFAIPDSSVKAGPSGWTVTLYRGQHRVVKSAIVKHFVPYGEAKPSTDGRFHACLHPSEGTMRCFYAPPPGS